MTKSVFNRREMKFLLDAKAYSAIVKLLPEYMEPDKNCGSNGEYTIYNIYYDTQRDDVIRKSIAMPYFKEKLRMRCYKMPVREEDLVYLELKKKIGGTVSKRRVALAFTDADRFIRTGERPKDLPFTGNQVLSEIRAFQERYRVFPRVFISYERTAFFGRDDKGFRVTFDKNILTRRDRPLFAEGDFGTELLDADRTLMEAKIEGAMPFWFARLLSETKAFRSGFSKYGEEYKKYARLYPIAGTALRTADRKSPVCCPTAMQSESDLRLRRENNA